MLPLLICVPNDRCVPEHLMQMNIPRFQEAHRGSCLKFQFQFDKHNLLIFLPFFLQSAHFRLSGFCNKSIKIFVCLSFNSLSATLACLVDIVVYRIKKKKKKEKRLPIW